MVADTYRSCPTSVRNFNCSWWWNRGCSFRLHAFLMQKIYRNILVLIAGFCALHLIFHGTVFLIVALTVLFLSTLSEKAAVIIERFWLWFGEKIGRVNAAMLLFLVYYLILTPIAFLSRIGSKDPLQLKAPEKSNFVLYEHKFRPEDLKNTW